MKIISAEIKQIGGLKDLTVNFTRGMNIICGPNGIGKSTILDTVSFAFTYGYSHIKKNIRHSGDGEINISIEFPKDVKKFTYSATTFSPQESCHNYEKTSIYVT